MRTMKQDQYDAIKHLQGENTPINTTAKLVKTGWNVVRDVYKSDSYTQYLNTPYPYRGNQAKSKTPSRVKLPKADFVQELQFGDSQIIRDLLETKAELVAQIETTVATLRKLGK